MSVTFPTTTILKTLSTTDLRLINLKTALNTIKELKPNSYVPKKKSDSFTNAKQVAFAFSPRAISVEIGQKQDGGLQKQDPLSYIPIINPRSILPLIEDSWQKGEIGLPTPQQEEKQAVRLIVIRRKKMRKHQRRKLWKRMRYRWAKVGRNAVDLSLVSSLITFPYCKWNKSISNKVTDR